MIHSHQYLQYLNFASMYLSNHLKGKIHSPACLFKTSQTSQILHRGADTNSSLVSTQVHPALLVRNSDSSQTLSEKQGQATQTCNVTLLLPALSSKCLSLTVNYLTKLQSRIFEDVLSCVCSALQVSN